MKTFLYEIDEAPTKFGIAFLNTYGAWDVYDFTGEIVRDQNVTRSNYQVEKEINANGSSNYGFMYNTVYDTSVTYKYTCNTGNIDSDTYDWLRKELITSNRVYSYTEEHQNYLLPELITATKSSNDTEYNITIGFVETIKENNVNI
jgi:hypothetical protein